MCLRCSCLDTTFDRVSNAAFYSQCSSSIRSRMGNACVSGGEQPQPQPAPVPACLPEGLSTCANTRCAPQAVGRVDLASALNDPALHPVSAYTSTERLLARLEALTLVSPVCQEQHAPVYRHALSLRQPGMGMRGDGTGAPVGALPCSLWLMGGA